jgi:hypothetical protein
VKLRDQLGRFLSPPAVADSDFYARVLEVVDAASTLRVAPRDDPRWAELRKAGYGEEGIDQVREFGSARGLSDPIEAMHAYEAQHPVPTMFVTPCSRFEGLNATRPAKVSDDVTQLLSGTVNENQWTDRVIAATLQELRSPDPSPVLHLVTAGFGG